MIHSMTAFARRETHGDWGNAVWELRSVNHRYLELNMRLPEQLTHLEPQLRERFKSQLSRGKVDVILHYHPSAKQQNLMINRDFVLQLLNAQAEVALLARNTTPIDPLQLLRWPGALQMGEIQLTQIEPTLLNTFEETLKEFIAIRQREGKMLQTALMQRLQSMQNEMTRIKKELPQIILTQREKLLARFQEAKINLDVARLEQEMLLFVQKIDVAEELERLEIHISEMKKTITQKTSQGRRLDFLLQESNREANTLGAKSNNAIVSAAVIELKLLIEQMREQAQNIE